MSKLLRGAGVGRRTLTRVPLGSLGSLSRLRSSLQTKILLRTVPAILKGFFFCAIYEYTGEDLKQGLVKSKNKIGGNHAFFRSN